MRKKRKTFEEWTAKDPQLEKGTLVEPSDCVLRENMGQGVVLSYTFSQYEVLFPKIGKRYRFYSTGLRKVTDAGPGWKMKKPGRLQRG